MVNMVNVMVGLMKWGTMWDKFLELDLFVKVLVTFPCISLLSWIPGSHNKDLVQIGIGWNFACLFITLCLNIPASIYSTLRLLYHSRRYRSNDAHRSSIFYNLYSHMIWCIVPLCNMVTGNDKDRLVSFVWFLVISCISLIHIFHFLVYFILHENRCSVLSDAVAMAISGSLMIAIGCHCEFLNIALIMANFLFLLNTLIPTFDWITSFQGYNSSLVTGASNLVTKVIDYLTRLGLTMDVNSWQCYVDMFYALYTQRELDLMEMEHNLRELVRCSKLMDLPLGPVYQCVYDKFMLYRNHGKLNILLHGLLLAKSIDAIAAKEKTFLEKYGDEHGFIIVDRDHVEKKDGDLLVEAEYNDEKGNIAKKEDFILIEDDSSDKTEL